MITELVHGPVSASSQFFQQQASILRGLVQIGYRGQLCSMSPNTTSQAANLSDGTQVSTMHRMTNTAQVACNEVRLLFVNQAYAAAGPNPYSVTCSIEGPGGQVTRGYFNGLKTGTVDPGGMVLTDPIPINFAKGDQFYVRMYVTVNPLGNKWPLSNFYGSATDGMSTTDGDVTGNNGALAAGMQPNVMAFGPAAILAKAPAGTPLVACWGDSLMVGINDNNGQPRGAMERAFQNQYPLLNLSVHGQQIHTLTFQNSVARDMLMPIAAGCTHVVMGDPTNDISGAATLVQIQGFYASMWAYLTARGIKVWGVTIPPRTTSTDAWATASNQTVLATESVRTTFNDWMRTTPAPLSGYSEIANTVEVNSANVLTKNGGFWKVGTTVDGIHGNPAGYALMALAVAPAAIVAS